MWEELRNLAIGKARTNSIILLRNRQQQKNTFMINIPHLITRILIINFIYKVYGRLCKLMYNMCIYSVFPGNISRKK